MKETADLEAVTNINLIEMENVANDKEIFGAGSGYTEVSAEGQAVETEESSKKENTSDVNEDDDTL